MIDQQTALYYSQIACDKVISQARLQIEFYKNLGRLTEYEERNFEQIIIDFETVKEYLKENLK